MNKILIGTLICLSLSPDTHAQIPNDLDCLNPIKTHYQEMKCTEYVLEVILTDVCAATTTSMYAVADCKQNFKSLCYTQNSTFFEVVRCIEDQALSDTDIRVESKLHRLCYRDGISDLNLRTCKDRYRQACENDGITTDEFLTCLSVQGSMKNQ